MAQRNPTVTATDATAAGSEELSSPSAVDLSSAINALNQAAQALTTTATQMMQMMLTVTSGPSVGQPPYSMPAPRCALWPANFRPAPRTSAFGW